MKWHTHMETPIGELTLVASSAGLHRVVFGHEDGPLDPLREFVDQLEEYFDRRRRDFDLPLVPEGTEFQMRVWQALRTIPYGVTRSYADMARAIGRPSAVRAVGAANGANPIPIIVPCHRVIGSNGSLTGFGGGLPTKRRLLDFESGVLPLLT